MTRKIVSSPEMNLRRAITKDPDGAVASGAVGALAMEMGLTDEQRMEREVWIERARKVIFCK